ncbi:protein KRBA1 isoform X2 [Aquila chrysaetos chrysaetos]|uniref:protein KRBA1 isoform X2 n=1 Tax=Aquila chrysaetos chrysaetos TaxID=223781 RepID=UPI0011769D12|nr:protein KRBA1 isoform X2 [Aquila chrysaetos chrysaetos]
MVAPHPPAPRDLPGRLGTGALLGGGGEPGYRHRHRQCPAAGGSGGTGPGLLGAAVPLRGVPGVGRQLQPRSAGSGAAPPLPAVLQRAPDPRCRAMAAPRQALVTFEDVEVRFSAEEWELLEEWQRALHREVTEGTSQLLASLGPPSSPALGALVQLVKEIPKFLFGGPKAGAEPGATSSRDAAAGSEQTGAGVKMEAPVETCPLRSLEKCLEELVVRGSGHPATPSPLASGSRAPGERQRGEPSGHQSLPGRRLLRGLATPPGPALAKSPAAPARCCPQSGDGAGHPGSVSGISFASSATREPAARTVAWGWDGGLCHSSMLPAAGSAGKSPLQGLLDCLRDIATPKPIPAWPAAAGRSRGAAVPGTGGCSVSAAGATAPAVPPRSPAKTRALGTHGTAVPGDTRPAGGSRPPACPPTAGMVTKRPFAEADAVSPPGSGMCPGSCSGVSLPKKRCHGMSPPSPRESPGEAQDPWAEVGRVRAVLVEELERLRRDLGSVRREARGVRSRLERLERGQAWKMAALARSHRRLRHAVRRLEGRCWALETRSRPNILRLLQPPEGEEGADAVGILQTTLPAAMGLLPAPAPLQIESARQLCGTATPARPLLFSLLRFTDKLALLRAAHRYPEPHSWAGTRLAIVPAACPPCCQDPLAAGRWAWRAAEPRCSTRCPAAGHGRGSVEP